MAIVYKYYPTARHDFFQNARFRLTNQTELDDPRDMIPKFNLYDLEKHIQLEIARLQRKYLDRPRTLADAEIALRIDWIRKNHTVYIEFLKKIALESYCKNIDVDIGILSLSKKPNVEDMWSRYCDGHQGFVIGLDTTSEFFKRKPQDRPDIGELVPVDYPAGGLEILIEDFKVSDRVLYTKNPEPQWVVQEEVRLIRELKFRDEVKTFDGKDIYLFSFPKQDIREVIFGCRSSEKLIGEITRDINTDLQYSDIVYKKANYDAGGKFSLLAFAP